jgi:hypothetical protein
MGERLGLRLLLLKPLLLCFLSLFLHPLHHLRAQPPLHALLFRLTENFRVQVRAALPFALQLLDRNAMPVSINPA